MWYKTTHNDNIAKTSNDFYFYPIKGDWFIVYELGWIKVDERDLLSNGFERGLFGDKKSDGPKLFPLEKQEIITKLFTAL